MTNQRGFSLIELAIVLVIVTLLIGGLAVPLSAQIQARRIAETKKTLEEARETILGYAMTHLTTVAGKRYLPCPDTNGDGREDRNLATQDCTLHHGWLPWVDLGTASQDAWGNRLIYAVNSKDAEAPSFADKSKGFSASTKLANPLQVCSTNTCPIPYNALTLPNPYVASNVVFVVASLGPNGWGALNISGKILAQPSGLDEKKNLNADQAYVSRTPTKPDAASGEFDDLLTWISLSQLIPKVCPTGSDCNP